MEKYSLNDSEWIREDRYKNLRNNKEFYGPVNERAIDLMTDEEIVRATFWLFQYISIILGDILFVFLMLRLNRPVIMGTILLVVIDILLIWLVTHELMLIVEARENQVYQEPWVRETCG